MSCRCSAATRALGALFDEASGRAGALVITGDPGTGKSALLVAAGSRAETTGRLVLRVAGVESEAAMPFAGLQQLLRPVMAAAGGICRAAACAETGDAGTTEGCAAGGAA